MRRANREDLENPRSATHAERIDYHPAAGGMPLANLFTERKRRRFARERRRLAIRTIIVAVSTAVLAAGFLGSFGYAQAGEAHEGTAVIAEELAAFGYELDLDGLMIETASPRKVRKDLVKQLTLLNSPEYFALMQTLMTATGIWIADSPDDLLKRSAKEYSSIALAYYRPDVDTFVLMEDSGNPLAQAVDPDFIIAHELIHAWRDQQSDLVELMRGGDPTVEEMQIRQCLSEGEAQFVATAFFYGRNDISLDNLTQDSLESPLDMLFSGTASLPYSKGAALALHYWQQGGWDAVRNMWENPPTSTEQILHLEKLGVDQPREVPLPDWPLADVERELIHDDCVGELRLFGLLTAKGIGPKEARVAAAGWDGDRLRIYRTSNGETALLWRTVWDRPKDARQFAAAMFRDTDGSFSVRGLVVDWVHSMDGALAPTLLEAIRADDWVPEIEKADIASTKAIEATWELELGEDPFLDQGRWVHPGVDLSFTAPEGWTQTKRGDLPILVEEVSGGLSANVLVMSLPNPLGNDFERMLEENRVQFERMGFEIESLELREIAGRQMMWVRAHGEIGAAVSSTSVIFLDGLKQVVVTATIPEAQWAEHEELVDALYASFEFGVKRFERHEHTHEQPRLEVPEAKTLSLRVGEHGEIAWVGGQDVWVVREDGIRQFSEGRDQSKNEELARLRGRRFRTNEDGEVEVPYCGRRNFWVYGRRGERFGFLEVSSHLRDQALVLELAPDLEVEVQVLDAEGNRVAGVPVGLLLKDEYWMGLAARLVTKGRRAKANWHHAFSMVPYEYTGADEVFVTFAFPCADAPKVRVWPRAESRKTPELALPETGSVLLRFETNEEDELDRWSTYYRNQFTSMRLASDEFDPYYEAPEVSNPDENSNEVLFPFVGLGLKLALDVPDGFRETTFTGPRLPGEQVEVLVRRKKGAGDSEER